MTPGRAGRSTTPRSAWCSRGLLFGITSYQVAPKLRLLLRLLSAVLFATAAGLLAALLSVRLFAAVPAGFWPVAGPVALLALASGAAAALALASGAARAPSSRPRRC